MFAARMGAAGLSFAHVMPTSPASEATGLNPDERAAAEREIALLARVFKMPITIDVGYYNVAPGAPCSPLAGSSANVDYRGQLTLCCILTGFRGAQASRTSSSTGSPCLFCLSTLGKTPWTSAATKGTS